MRQVRIVEGQQIALAGVDKQKKEYKEARENLSALRK